MKPHNLYVLIIIYLLPTFNNICFASIFNQDHHLNFSVPRNLLFTFLRTKFNFKLQSFTFTRRRKIWDFTVTLNEYDQNYNNDPHLFIEYWGFGEPCRSRAERWTSRLSSWPWWRRPICWRLSSCHLTRTCAFTVSVPITATRHMPYAVVRTCWKARMPLTCRPKKSWKERRGGTRGGAVTTRENGRNGKQVSIGDGQPYCYRNHHVRKFVLFNICLSTIRQNNHA